MIKHKQASINSSAIQAPGKVEHITAHEGIRQDVPVNNLNSVKDMTNLVLSHDVTLRLREPLIAADEVTAHEPDEIPSFVKYLTNDTFLDIFTEDFDNSGYAYIKKLNIRTKQTGFMPKFCIKYIEVTGADEYKYPSIDKATTYIDFRDESLLETLAIHKNAKFEVVDGQLQINGISLTVRRNGQDLFSGNNEHALYRDTEFNVNSYEDLTLGQGLKVFISFYRENTGEFVFEIRVPERTTLTGDVNSAKNAEFNLALSNPYAISDLYKYGSNSVSQILAYNLTQQSITPKTDPKVYIDEVELPINITEAIFNINPQLVSYTDSTGSIAYHSFLTISVKQNFSLFNLHEAWGKKTFVKNTEIEGVSTKYLSHDHYYYIEVKIGDTVLPNPILLPKIGFAGDILFNKDIEIPLPTETLKTTLKVTLTFKAKKLSKNSLIDESIQGIQLYLFDNEFNRDTDYSRIKVSSQMKTIDNFTKSFHVINAINGIYIYPSGLEEYGYTLSYNANDDAFKVRNLSLLDPVEYQLWHRFAYEVIKPDTENPYPYKDYTQIENFSYFLTFMKQNAEDEFKISTYQNTSFTLDLAKNKVIFKICYYSSEEQVSISTINDTPVETLFSSYIVDNATNVSTKIISSLPDDAQASTVLKAFLTSSSSNYTFCNWEVSDKDLEEWGTLEEFVTKNKGNLPFYKINVPDTMGESKESLYDVSNYTLTKTVVPFKINSGLDPVKSRPDVQPLTNTSRKNKFKFNVYFYKADTELSEATHILNFVPYSLNFDLDNITGLCYGSTIYNSTGVCTATDTYNINKDNIILAAAIHPYFTKLTDIFDFYNQTYNLKVEYTTNASAKTITYTELKDYTKQVSLKPLDTTTKLCQAAVFHDENGLTPIILKLNEIIPTIVGEHPSAESIQFRISFTFQDQDTLGNAKQVTRCMYLLVNYQSTQTEFMLNKSEYDAVTNFIQNTSNGLHILDKHIILNTPSSQILTLTKTVGNNVQYNKDIFKLDDATDFYNGDWNIDKSTKTPEPSIKTNEDIQFIKDTLLLGYAILATPVVGNLCGDNHSTDTGGYDMGALSRASGYTRLFQVRRNMFGWWTDAGYYGTGIIPRFTNKNADGIYGDSTRGIGDPVSAKHIDMLSMADLVFIAFHSSAYTKAFWANRVSNFIDNIDNLLNDFKTQQIQDLDCYHIENVKHCWLPVTGDGDYSSSGTIGWKEAGTRIIFGKATWQFIEDELYDMYKNNHTSYNRDQLKEIFTNRCLDAIFSGGAQTLAKTLYNWGYNLRNKIYTGGRDYWNFNSDTEHKYKIDYILNTTLNNTSTRSQIGALAVFKNTQISKISTFLTEQNIKFEQGLITKSIMFDSLEIAKDDNVNLYIDKDTWKDSYKGNLVYNDGINTNIPIFSIIPGNHTINIHFTIEFKCDNPPTIAWKYLLKLLISNYLPTIVLFTTNNAINLQYISYTSTGNADWKKLNDGDVDPRFTNTLSEYSISDKKWEGCPIYLSNSNNMRQSASLSGQVTILENNPGPVNYWIDPILGAQLNSKAILLSSKEYRFDNSTKNLVLLNPEEQPGLLEPDTYGEIPTSKYLQYRFFVWGVANYENSLFYSKTGSYEFPVLNTIEFTGDVTQVIEWRNYILVFTTKCIYLLSYDPNTDTYNSKLIHQNEGVPREYARTIKTILNGIIFRGYSGQVYKLIPNMYSSSDNILNIRLLSEGIEHSLENDLYGNTDKDRFTSFAFSDSETYKLFIVKPKPEHESGTPVDATWCLTYNYEKDTWTKQHYPVYATNIIEVEGIPYMITDTNKHYEFYKTDLWLEDDVDNPNKRNIRYGDYLKNTKEEITYESTCIPIPFYIDFGQKASKYNIMKSYLEARFMFQTQHEKDYFPFNVEVYTDGIKRILKRDANTYSSFTKSSNKDILSLSRNQNLYSIDTDSAKDTMRQFIIKYTGHGRTINFVVSGESNTPFKFYSIDSLNRDIPKK